MSQPSRIDISALCFAMGMLPAEWAVSNVVVYVWIHDIRFGVPVPPAEMMAALAFVGAFYVGWSFAAFWFFQFMDQREQWRCVLKNSWHVDGQEEVNNKCAQPTGKVLFGDKVEGVQHEDVQWVTT
eukprot:5764423-Amphidinium_carterae.1